MKKCSTLTRRLVSLAIAFVMMLQILPFSIFESSAALTETPLRPQLLGGSLDVGDDNVLSVYVFGDALIQANSMMDIVKNFAAKDGIRLEIAANTWNNEGTASSTYNLWELFEWSAYATGSSVRPATGATIIGPKGSKLQFFLDTIESDTPLAQKENPIDHIILLSGRDMSVNNYPDAQIKCVQWFAQQLSVHAPEAELNLFAPPGFSTNYSSSAKTNWGFSGTMTRKEHNTLIKAHAEAQKSAINTIATSVYPIGDAWESFFTNSDLNKNAGILLYANDKRNPSLAGSYFNACLLYLMLTGNSPVGMDIYGQMPEDEAKILQRAAHIIVKGEEPTVSYRNNVGALTLDTLTQPAVNDSRLQESASEYPTYFNELMATAIAFDQRGSWVQYDQTSFNEKSPWDSLYRRVISDNLMAPEQATPQTPYYTDCSAWTNALYSYTFGFYFNADGNNSKGSSDLTSTSKLCRLRDSYKNANPNLCVWDWGDGSAVTTAERDAAINSFYNSLQPGDIIVYTSSYGSSLEGHAVIYVGNGYIMHCSGASQAAMGGADYNVTAKHDKHEANGSILVEPLSVFSDPSGYRFLFKQENEIVILRPFAARSLTPTAQATARLSNLLNIVAYKETSAPTGVTVTPGQEVTFTYHVKNLNSEAKAISIEETLPSGLIYVSSDGVYTSSSNKIRFSTSVSAGEEKALRLTVRVSPTASGKIAMDKTATINGVYLNSTPIIVGRILSMSQQSKLTEILPSMTDYTDGYSLATALYSELGYTLPFTNGGAALTNLFDHHETTSSRAEHFVLTTSNTEAFAMMAPNLFGGQYVYCNDIQCCSLKNGNREKRTSGDYMRTRSMLEEYLIPGDLLIYGNISSSPTATVYIYAGDSTFYTATSAGLSAVSGSRSVQFLEGLIAQDVFCVLRPSITLPCSKPDVNVLFIGGTSNTAAIRQSNTALKTLLETDGGYNYANVNAISLGGERVTFYNILSSANSDGTVTVGSDFMANYNSITSALAPDSTTKYDYVMVSLGKEWNLVTDFSSYKNKEYGGFAHIEKLLYAHNPDATLVIQAGAGYKNMNGEDLPICIWGSNTQKYYTIGENYADHTARIEKQAYEFKTSLDSNNVPIKTEVLCVGDAFLTDSDNSLQLFNLGWTTPSKNDTSYEYHHYYLPVNTSAYLVAGMMYNTIVGSLPESFTVTSWTDGTTSRSVTATQLTEINTILRDATADLRVLFIGGSAPTATMRNSDAALRSMLINNGGYTNPKVDFINIGGERGRFDTLFSSFGDDGTPVINTGVIDSYNSIISALSSDAIYKYDYIFVHAGREWNLVEGSVYESRENLSFKWLEQLIYSHNSKATLLIGAPAGYLDVDGENEPIKIYGTSSQQYYTIADGLKDHTARIKNRATEIVNCLNDTTLDLNVALVNYGSAIFDIYSEGYSVIAMGYGRDEGPDQRHHYGPENPNAFIVAAAVYSKISNENPTSVTVTDWSGGTINRSVANDCANYSLKALKDASSDVNVLLIGGSAVNETLSHSDSALQLMFEQDGGYSSANIDVIHLDGAYGRMDNIFSYTGSVADGFTVVGPNSSNATRATIAQQIIDALAPNSLITYDHVVISVAPFWNLTPADSGVYGPREIAAFEYAEELLAAHNPNAILHIASGQGWITDNEYNGTGTSDDCKIYAGTTDISFMGNNYADHTAKIKAQADLIKAELESNTTTLDISLIDIGTSTVALFEAGVDTHSDHLLSIGSRKYLARPNNCSAYAFAAVVYHAISGQPINEITVTQWNPEGSILYIDAQDLATFFEISAE